LSAISRDHGGDQAQHRRTTRCRTKINSKQAHVQSKQAQQIGDRALATGEQVEDLPAPRLCGSVEYIRCGRRPRYAGNALQTGTIGNSHRKDASKCRSSPCRAVLPLSSGDCMLWPER
jgi:hypothetical protein